MAAPVPQSVGAFAQTSGGNPALSFAPGAPSGVNVGDLLELHFTIDSVSVTITLPSGFAHAGGSPVIINTGGNQGNIVAFKWADSADVTTSSLSGTYTVSFSANTFAEGQIIRVSGARGSGNPYDNTATATNPSSGSTSTPAVSFNTSSADCLIVHAYTKVNSGAFTPNAGYTTRVSGGFNTVGASTIAQPVAGPTGTVQATKATTDQSTAWLGAILPASGSSATWLPGQRSHRSAPILPRRDRIAAEPPVLGGQAPPPGVSKRRARSSPTPRLRARMVTPVRPQVNPPYPTNEEAQPRRLRGLPGRRDRVVMPPWPQLAPPVNPDWIPAGRRPRPLPELPRRERVVTPVPAAGLFLPAGHRPRLVEPALRPRRQERLVITAVAPPTNPPIVLLQPHHRTLLLPVRRRGRVTWIPLVSAGAPVLGPDVLLVLGPPEGRWTAGPPGGRWTADDPDSRWSASPPEV